MHSRTRLVLAKMRVMQDVTLHALRARRAEIFSRWEALLRAEPTTSPLGTPDALVYMLGQTFDELLTALAEPKRKLALKDHHCLCGCNPLLAYFRSAEQALLEALVLIQAGRPQMTTRQRQAELEELQRVVKTIGEQETSVICSICQRCAGKRAGAAR
ncbi:MAG: hypothetical protein HYV95_04945 [Opitutae bacterium]|nr:hypothetical protein [Opitutae bacterium]